MPCFLLSGYVIVFPAKSACGRLEEWHLYQSPVTHVLHLRMVDLAPVTAYSKAGHFVLARGEEAPVLTLGSSTQRFSVVGRS